MSAEHFYQSSVPVFIRYLQGLDKVLQKIEELPLNRQQEILSARLAPDMLNFLQQAETAIQFSLRTLFSITKQEIPSFYICDSTASLRNKLHARIDTITKMPNNIFLKINQQSDIFSERAGNATINLSLNQFLYEFSIPNFLFHISMAYAIARANGINIGKSTYDGFHQY